MARKRQQTVDLATVFQAVSDNLVEHRSSLNQADSYNHDHGDNMVEIFGVINEAIGAKRDKKPATQLAYASKMLKQRSQSGSAKIYASGLDQASQQYKGKAVTPGNISTLLQSLMGGQAPSQPSSNATADLLGSLLGAATGGQGGGAQAPGSSTDLLSSMLGAATGGQAGGAQAPGPSADLLGSLLGGAGGSQTASSQQGLDLGDLLNAGVAFMNSQQQGDSSLESIIKAFVAATQVGQNPYRAQSGELVANSVIQSLGRQSRR
jgi:hypothetical protein